MNRPQIFVLYDLITRHIGHIFGVLFFCVFSQHLFATTIPRFDYTDLTLEEKVGQLLIVHFHGESINDDARKLIHELHVGGFIYYNWANGLTSPEKVAKLSQELQECAQKTNIAIPLFIGVDQEGGVVNRLIEGFTVFPGNRVLGEISDRSLCWKNGYALSKEISSVGINIDFAPVVDINSNPKNPVIGVRSFGSSPNVVIPCAKAFLSGMKEAGVISCIKHFPGHGDVESDSHVSLPVVRKAKRQLDSLELRPFRELASYADTVMTAHILLPDIDSEFCATISEKTISLLRNEIGFQGPIITDSLIMEGLLKNAGGSVDDACVQALQAGCDILLLGGKQLIGSKKDFELTIADVERIHHRIVTAVKNGEIPEEKINLSLQRIFSVKQKYSSTMTSRVYQPLSSEDLKKHTVLAHAIASQALSVVGAFPKSYHPSRIVLFSPELMKKTFMENAVLQKWCDQFHVSPVFYSGLSPSYEETQKCLELLEESDMALIISYNSWKSQDQQKAIHAILDTKKMTCLIVARDPLDALLFPDVSISVTTFSPTPISIEEAIKKIFYSLDGKTIEL